MDLCGSKSREKNKNQDVIKVDKDFVVETPVVHLSVRMASLNIRNDQGECLMLSSIHVKRSAD